MNRPPTLSLTQQMAKHLRERRQWRQLSQTQLAARVGTSQATIARLESGHSNPTLAQIERLMAALGYELVVQTRPT